MKLKRKIGIGCNPLKTNVEKRKLLSKNQKKVQKKSRKI